MNSADLLACTCLTPQQRELFKEGFHLVEHVEKHKDQFGDYSFVVFPFAKAYEGFLKEVFLKSGMIEEEDYLSKHFRIGKVMSPNMEQRLQSSSVYRKICNRKNCDLSEKIWRTWKVSRNQVFHYYPDNYEALSFDEAVKRIEMISSAVIEVCKELG